MKRSLTGAGVDVTAALLAHLNAERAYWMVELISFQFVTIGTGNPPTLTLYWTTSAVDIPYGPVTYDAHGPLVEREQIRTVRGTEADTMDLEIQCGDVMLPAPHNSISLRAALAAGLGDGAVVTVRRAFLPPYVPNVRPNTDTLGAVLLFLGRVSEKDVTRSRAKLRVTSFLEQLNAPIPRGIFQPGCQNTLADPVCGVDLAPLVHTTTLSKVSAGGAFGLTTPAPTDRYWPLGVLELTSGKLRGLRISIKRMNGTAIVETLYGLKILPTAGDGVKLYPGCDKTLQMCGFRYNNVQRFRGFPYIPTPENAL